LTPTLLVPRKCQDVSRGRFWIIMPVKTTSSVSTGPKILWSERYKPYVISLLMKSKSLCAMKLSVAVDRFFL
jgi:hypothetical protein